MGSRRDGPGAWLRVGEDEMVHFYNPSTGQGEAERSGAEGQPGLHSESEASLSYARKQRTHKNWKRPQTS